MHFLNCVLMLVFAISDDILGCIVRGPSGPLVVPLGSSVILLCYVETPLVAEKVKVVWSRADSETLVHLYEDGESHPEAQHKDYHDRAHFFTDQIQHGNFSLLLENVRAEDKGVYRCKVYSQQDADTTLVEIKPFEYLLVSGSDESISVSVGEDVSLNCSVESHVTPEHIEEVSWMKTDKEGHILVLLYQNNKTLPKSAHERYRDRVEFFTAEIPKGNFSLRLKSARTEGVYMCQVFVGGLSANATAELGQLGFSWLHIIVLILCIIACGFALSFCWITYSRSENRDTRLCLQACLFLCPFITMLLASIIWHVIEGSFPETVSCCMFYILGPLRLFWVTPLGKAFPDKILKYIMTAHADHAAFMAVMYSVLLAEHYENISTVFRTVTFGLLVLMCLFFIISILIELDKEKLLSCYGKLCRRMYSTVQPFVATCGFSWLPSLQLALLLYSHFASAKVDAGLICVAGLVQALWVLVFSEVPVHYQKLSMRKCLLLYGSAGLVLANSVALMTELIMKAVHGVHLVGDLRIILFPLEWLFTVALLILSIVASCKQVDTKSQDASRMSTDYNGTPGTGHTSIDMNQVTRESHEMETLRKGAGNSEEHQEEEMS